jgi:EAL domain-containing protein (putative c-di-GMP-specific phosphodiesterase class I)
VPAEKLARRLLQALEEPISLAERPVSIGASIGIATSDSAEESAEDLLRNADLAMYQVKAHGGGALERFNSTTHAASLSRLELEQDLAVALDHSQFELHYQPVVRLDTGEYAGAEALLRWRHPTRGLLAPNAFLDLAERTGCIVGIGEWVLDQACRELRIWQANHCGTRALGVDVNLSGRQFGPRLITSVRAALRNHSLDPSCLTLEVTEGLIQAEAAVVADTIEALKQIGVWLAIDDFGTGHSSLVRLRDYAFDELKIDRGFVQDLDTGDITLVAAQIALAKGLGVQVVAEGVETQTQLEILRDLQCTQLQGYLFARPLPAMQVRPLLANFARVPALEPERHLRPA